MATGEVKAVLAAAVLLVAVPLALELAVRRTGVGTFPLYEPTIHGGYRLRPGQAGEFLRRHRWRYDANGMRNEEAPPDFAASTLLIGDSVVDGGLRIDQNETLAALATRLCGEPFYNVAAPGWSLANGLAALRALPGWTGARRLVFVLNTPDLDSVARMDGELNYPTRRPAWLTLWLALRHARRHAVPSARDGGEGADVRARNLADFRELLAAYAGPVILVRYPMRGEDPRAERYFEQLAALDSRVRIVEAADAAGWSEECYLDHIHPNARGLEVLARHLCEELS